MIGEFNLGNRVKISDHRENCADLIRSCDIVVVPSRSDARPRVIIEAMHLGKCVVASNVGGIPSLISNGMTGLLVPPENPNTLSEILDSLCRDPHQRLAIGQAAMKYAASHLDPISTCRNYLSEYRKLANRSASHSLQTQDFL